MNKACAWDVLPAVTASTTLLRLPAQPLSAVVAAATPARLQVAPLLQFALERASDSCRGAEHG